MENYEGLRGMVAGANVGMAQRNTYQPEPSPIRDTIGGVANDLDGELQRLQMLHTALEQIAERLDGPVPQQSGADVAKLDAPAHSLLDSMRRKQRSAQLTISRCEAAVSRIANALGM
jgi:hypothetical protein